MRYRLQWARGRSLRRQRIELHPVAPRPPNKKFEREISHILRAMVAQSYRLRLPSGSPGRKGVECFPSNNEPWHLRHTWLDADAALSHALPQQHFLYFFPLLQGKGLLQPILEEVRIGFVLSGDFDAGLVAFSSVSSIIL